MFSYRICGTTFCSNVRIPELPPGNEGRPEFTFQQCTETRDDSESCHWLNHWNSIDGSIWLAFGRLEAGYLLRFPDFADFVVAGDARTLSCYLRENCPPETMRHLLLNQVIPILLSHLGKLVLHASACVTSYGVVAFMGVTGAGKSTLAASFGQRGFAILTDDCLLVEEQGGVIKTVPSYPGLRLWPETVEALFEEKPVLQPLAHYTDKKRILFDQDHIDSPLSLGIIYVLTQPDMMPDVSNVIISPMATSEALLETVRHTFQLDITDRKRLGQAFKRHEWLAKSVPFFRLAFPRDHDFLPAVNIAILDHLDTIQNRERIQKQSTPNIDLEVDTGRYQVKTVR
jgi:hypothetical protein